MSHEVSKNEELKLSITHLQEEISNLKEKHTRDKQRSEFEFERLLFSEGKKNCNSHFRNESKKYKMICMISMKKGCHPS